MKQAIYNSIQMILQITDQYYWYTCWLV